MLHRFIRFAPALAVLLSCTAMAEAQALSSPRSLKPVEYPRWDSGGTFGLFGVTREQTHGLGGGFEQQLEYRFDLGRYWTTHLKTEIGLGTSGGWDDYESRQEAVAGSSGPRYSVFTIHKRLHGVMPSVTWQFRENTFMHPFVSAGARVGILQQHWTRPDWLSQSGLRAPVDYDLSPVDERTTSIVARPFAAAGFKSYFSRSVYARTELQVAFASHGVSQVAVRAGVGVDF